MMAAVLLLVLTSCGSGQKPAGNGTAQGGADQSQSENTAGSGAQPAGEGMVITVTNVLFDDSPENVALAQFKEEIEEIGRAHV